MAYHYAQADYAYLIPAHGPVRAFVLHGYLAVDLFFVLSGFVMALNYQHLFEDGFSNQNYSIFLYKRLTRIYPLYIMVSAHLPPPRLTACSLPSRKVVDVTTRATIQASGDPASRPHLPVA